MKIYNMIFKVISKIKHDKIFVYSSHASFYMLISAIPFTTLFISLIKQFVSVSEYEISNVLLPFFPIATQNAAQEIIKEVFNKPSGTFISFSAVSLLWTASRGISGIRRGLRFIYDLPSPQFFVDVLSGIALMLFMIVIILLLFIAAICLASVSSGMLIFLIGLFFLTAVFSLIYFLFSGRKIPFKAQIPGAVSASLSWIIFIRIFSFYIEHFSNYSYVYGSLTTILILALWIYFSIIIFFLGAELNIMLFSGFFEKTD